MIENLKAVPGLARGRHIEQRQQNSSDDLKQKHHERGAAEDVSPARALARDTVLERVADGFRKLQTRLEPGAKLFDYAHGDFPPEMLIRREVGAPVVGISPAWINRFPCSTL